MTVRTGQSTTETVSQLWKDGLLRRLDLEPLSQHDSGAPLQAALGDQSTLRALNECGISPVATRCSCISLCAKNCRQGA